MGYERYQGPYLHQLTVDDLRKTKPTWQQFFYNGTSAAGWQDAYNVPEHLGMLQERMEENLVYYLVTSHTRLGTVAFYTFLRVSYLFLTMSLWSSLTGYRLLTFLPFVAGELHILHRGCSPAHHLFAADCSCRCNFSGGFFIRQLGPFG